MRSFRVALALLALAVATGCSGSGKNDATPTPTSAVTTPAVAPCPSPNTAARTQWPTKVPADLPKPANAKIAESTTASDGVFIVKFSTPTSLRESVIFVVTEYPKAGYQLGRGDAEAVEADAPFVRGDLRGLVRMIQAGTCKTQWLLATVNTKAGPTSPLLPVHTPSGSPSPLPFG